jgi:hypothetical protein
MAIYSSEEARKRYDSLPEEVKNLLYSPEMSFIIQQIGQKNRLHIDQIDALNTEVGQVMLGFIEPKDFPIALAKMLHVDQTQAQAVVKDVNDMLFEKIRNSMKGVANQEAGAPSSLPPPPPAPRAPEPTKPPQKPGEIHPADVLLSQKTVSTPPVVPAVPPETTPSSTSSSEVPQKEQKPPQYKVDPYREPPE